MVNNYGHAMDILKQLRPFFIYPAQTQVGVYPGRESPQLHMSMLFISPDVAVFWAEELRRNKGWDVFGPRMSNSVDFSVAETRVEVVVFVPISMAEWQRLGGCYA